MEKYRLRDRLEKVRDGRRKAGQRHSTGNVLMIVFMATMSGFLGYRAMGDFVKKYHKELLDYLKPNKDRLPSYSTIRRTLDVIDKDDYLKILEEWTLNNFDQDDDKWIAIDGKSIKGSGGDNQKIIHLVSMFRHKSKDVLFAKNIDEKSNEIPVVRELIAKFPFKNMIFTVDAMHTQVETIKAVKESGNDIVVQVKKTKKSSIQN